MRCKKLGVPKKVRRTYCYMCSHFGVKWGVFGVKMGCFWGKNGQFVSTYINKSDEVFRINAFLCSQMGKNGLFWVFFGVKSLIFWYFLVLFL